ncbi:MAG: peptide chain release factor N(5)-glutamine methyltransferase [Succinivibrio sp.]
MVTVKQALTDAKRELGVSSVTDCPSLEASVLLSAVTGYTKVQLITHDEEILSDAAYFEYQKLISKRKTGYPVAYLTGHKEFWGLDLKVTEDTLIPRPDTETLVQCALDAKVSGKVLDLGTGSGAIILALKSEYGDRIDAYACDFSQGALDVAMENGRNLNLKVNFILSDWLSAIDKSLKFSLIVSNPPYIEKDDPHLLLSSLPFEPSAALSSGEDGLDDIRRISNDAYDFLESGAYLMIEHGYNQGEAVRDILKRSGYVNAHTQKDLEGRDRVSIASHP